MFCVWGRRIRTDRIYNTEMRSVRNGRVRIVTPLCAMLPFQHFRIANQHIYCLLQAILDHFPPYLYSLLLQLQPELWKTLSVASFISHLIDRPDPTLEHEAATPSSDLPLNPRKIVNAPSPSQFVFPSLSLYPTCEHISISRSWFSFPHLHTQTDTGLQNWLTLTQLPFLLSPQV